MEATSFASRSESPGAAGALAERGNCHTRRHQRTLYVRLRKHQLLKS